MRPEMWKSNFCKAILSVGVAAVLLTSATTPSWSRERWVGSAAAGALGFAAGAAVGSAVGGYDRGYYGRYGYAPHGYYGAYGYAPYNRTYAYAPYRFERDAYAYAPPRFGYTFDNQYMRGEYASQFGPAGGCWIATDSQRGYGYWGECTPTRRDAGRAAISGQYGRSTRLVPPTR